MFSKLQFQNLLIYENNSNFVQVQGQENLQNTTVNINLYRSLNYIFTLTFKLKNDSSKVYSFGKQRDDVLVSSGSAPRLEFACKRR